MFGTRKPNPYGCCPSCRKPVLIPNPKKCPRCRFTLHP